MTSPAEATTTAKAETANSTAPNSATGTSTEPGPAKQEQVEEIVVTAAKREENLQKVPIAVTALSGETLVKTGISNVEDLQFFVPGVSVTNDSMAIINIRGIGTSAFGVATDPSTTVHYDGVYIPRPTTSYQDMFDVERIEVLRGPQGVLFGRNSAGGTLNIISKMPTRDLSGTFGVTVGNYDKRTFSGTVSGPLGSDDVRARITVVRNTRDGIYHDAVTGRPYQNEDNLAGRATLAIDPTSNFQIVLRADGSKDRETGYPAVRPFYPPEFAAAGATIPTRRNQIALDTPPRFYVDAGGVSSTMTYNAGSTTLRSITAYRASKVSQVLDVDATDLFLRNIEFYERSKSFTQEFQVFSDNSRPFRWIVGAFYLNEKGKDEIRIVEPARAIAIPESNTTNAYALFGQGTYALGRARLTAGLRYSYEKKDFAYRIFVGPTQVDSGTPSDSWTAWTPKFGIDYDLTDEVMAYASATRGFKSGGFQLGDGRPFLPEYLWSYEAGVKSTLFDHKLRANAAAFYYDYTNLQVVQYINGVATTTNAGKATIKGVELEFLAKPAQRVTLTSTVAYLDARYDLYFDAGTSLAGNRLPNAPKWNLTFGTEYRAPLGSLGDLTLRGDIAYRSRVFFKPNNNPLYGGSTTTLVNGRIAWQPHSQKFEVALYGRNLLNERYASYKAVGTDVTGVSNPALPLIVYGEPRQYGLQLRYFF
ncbi:MAG: TonB-dependent receptor [Pseudomonadota bacterium]